MDDGAMIREGPSRMQDLVGRLIVGEFEEPTCKAQKDRTVEDRLRSTWRVKIFQMGHATPRHREVLCIFYRSDKESRHVERWGKR